MIFAKLTPKLTQMGDTAKRRGAIQFIQLLSQFIRIEDRPPIGRLQMLQRRPSGDFSKPPSGGFFLSDVVVSLAVLARKQLVVGTPRGYS